MKILLDENLPVQFIKLFDDNHEWYTVRGLGWQGIKNGTLLQLMAENNFNFLVTMNKNLYQQQNLKSTHVSIIIVKAKDNKLPTLQSAVEPIKRINELREY